MPETAELIFTYWRHVCAEEEKAKGRVIHDDASFSLTHLFYQCRSSVLFFIFCCCFLYIYNVTLLSSFQANQMQIGRYANQSVWTLLLLADTIWSTGSDINKEGLRLFPSCQIPSKYFPVVLLYTSPLWALGGISITRHNNVFCNIFVFPLYALKSRSKSRVYLAQDFNHYKTDWADPITPEESALVSRYDFANCQLKCTLKTVLCQEV